MNPTPEITDEILAKLIVGDSIRAAFTNPNLVKGATVEDMNDLLNGPFADVAVQGMLATYAASEFAATVIGGPIQLNLDSRLTHSQRVRLTPSGLKLGLQKELRDFLDLTTAEQQSYVQGLLTKTVS